MHLTLLLTALMASSLCVVAQDVPSRRHFRQDEGESVYRPLRVVRNKGSKIQARDNTALENLDPAEVAHMIFGRHEGEMNQQAIPIQRPT